MKAKMKPSIQEILARNPHLDRRLVREMLKLSKHRKAGRAGYGLSSPSTHKRVSVRRDPADKTIILSRAIG